MRYETRNPATGELIQSYKFSSTSEVEAALALAQEKFSGWRALSFEQRAAPLLRVAALLEERAERLGQQMAEEVGKPWLEGIGEAKKCAWVCRFYAEHAESFLKNSPRHSDGSEAFVRYDPIGSVFGIMPWNFPFWQVFRFVAPTLMAGNVVLLKHAPNSPGAGEEIASLMTEAGFPSGVYQNLRLTDEQAAEVIKDSRVAGVTLTGSTRAGQSVARLGGEVLKPMVMELGGSDPFLIFEDADLSKAVQDGVFSRCLNNGQSCIAAKRFLVHQSLYLKFLQSMKQHMEAIEVGDPLQEGVTMGPLARADLRDHLKEQVERSLAAGASIAFQGKAPTDKGYFYPPTLLTQISADNPAAQEELFGPVALVFPFQDEAEAIAIANATPYGLGASLWTQDSERIQRMIRQLEAGNVFVNGFVKSDPRLPFGGTKQSGFGRELGREGILAFVNAKTVWIR